MFFGAILICYFNEHFGRRVALFAAGWAFNIGVVIQVAMPTFYVGRVISGLGIGGTSFVVPQYLSETAPPVARGGIIG